MSAPRPVNVIDLAARKSDYQVKLAADLHAEEERAIRDASYFAWGALIGSAAGWFMHWLVAG